MNRNQKIGGHPTSRVPIAGAKPIPGKKGASFAPVQKVQTVLPVRIIDAVLQQLPNPALQQLGETVEFPYDVSEWTVAGQERFTPVLTVPDTEVYIITDVIFYALRAGTLPASPPVLLDDYALSSTFLFDITFSRMSAMRLITTPVETYPTGPIPQTLQARSGWARLNSNFGATRTVPFALYAHAGQEIHTKTILTTPTQLPPFGLLKIGCTVSGIALSATSFDRIWQSQNTKGR